MTPTMTMVLRVPTIANPTTAIVMGRKSGNVTLTNLVNAFAPSISAASKTATGTACKPTTNSRQLTPVACQAEATTMASVLSGQYDNHAVELPGMPNSFKMSPKAPPGWRMKPQITAIPAPDIA